MRGLSVQVEKGQRMSGVVRQAWLRSDADGQICGQTGTVAVGRLKFQPCRSGLFCTGESKARPAFCKDTWQSAERNCRDGIRAEGKL